ncbi:MAG TPA: acyloxyacyl hydrolase [Candidatus Bathyarchaeia archaeon]|nr:acyloxyacyl hydrolase [Candidatus Bathyarchaeia archaeon]
MLAGFAVWTACSCLAPPARAQSEPAAPGTVTTGADSQHGREEFGIWGGGSIGTSTLIGRRPDLDFDLGALRYGRSLWRKGKLGFDWTADVVPVAFLTLDRSRPGEPSSGRESVYGAGISPLGFRFDFELLSWLRPYAAATGGLLYFADRIPAAGTKFNFTYDFGAGAQIFVLPDRAFTLGYRYQHISNAGLSDSNPGFDSNVLYMGFSLFR